MDNLTNVELGLVKAVDVSYLLLTGMNILIMQAGFTALEAGGSRAKNVKSVLFKNFMDHSVGSLAWFTVGWGLFVGSDPFAGGPDATFFIHPIEQYARLFQQFAFAATAATIVSGAVTGRCRLEPYVVLSAFLSGVSYPIVAHWAWNDFGWLRTMGFLDFAGSLIVHGLGGSVALVTAWACGPRPGRFVSNNRKTNTTDTDRSPATQLPVNRQGSNGSMIDDVHASSHSSSILKKARCPPTLPQCPSRCRPRVFQTRVVPKGFNPPLMVVGSLLLYVAWFSFNAGSAGSIYLYPDSAVRAAVNTMLAAGAASVTCMLLTLVVGIKYDIEMACNCMLSGLVAITAGCGFLDPWAAVVSGIVAAPLYIVSAWFVLHVLGVDDVLGAVSVHGTCGAFGTIWLGLTHPELGLFYGAGAKFLGVQALAIVVVGGFAAITALLVVLVPFMAMRRLSYNESEQLIGIDFVHFGGEFGKDVDLESDAHRRNSFHSEKDDLESNDGRSNNSNFIDGDFVQDNPSVHSVPPHALQNGSVVELGPPGSRVVRAFSTNTLEGRKAMHHELRRVLDDDPRVRHRFRAYLEVMHREEGVAFWDEVAKWKNITGKKHVERKQKEAKRIIKTYCMETGSKQVNLASKDLKILSAAMEDRDELLNNKLFDAALEELFKDLKVAFMEFVEQTPNYWM